MRTRPRFGSPRVLTEVLRRLPEIAEAHLADVLSRFAMLAE
jgi:hypothetical protein